MNKMDTELNVLSLKYIQRANDGTYILAFFSKDHHFPASYVAATFKRILLIHVIRTLPCALEDLRSPANVRYHAQPLPTQCRRIVTLPFIRENLLLVRRFSINRLQLKNFVSIR